MAKKKKVLLWIEDNSSKELRELIQKPAEKKELILVHVNGVQILHDELEKLTNDEDVIVKGIILDLMIYGTNNLSSFGYYDVEWEDAADAGEYLLKYVLRNENPKQEYLTKLELHKVPIQILTVKSETSSEDFIKYGEKIELAHKYDEDEQDLGEVLTNWINGI